MSILGYIIIVAMVGCCPKKHEYETRMEMEQSIKGGQGMETTNIMLTGLAGVWLLVFQIQDCRHKRQIKAKSSFLICAAMLLVSMFSSNICAEETTAEELAVKNAIDEARLADNYDKVADEAEAEAKKTGQGEALARGYREAADKQKAKAIEARKKAQEAINALTDENRKRKMRIKLQEADSYLQELDRDRTNKPKQKTKDKTTIRKTDSNRSTAPQKTKDKATPVFDPDTGDGGFYPPGSEPFVGTVDERKPLTKDVHKQAKPIALIVRQPTEQSNGDKTEGTIKPEMIGLDLKGGVKVKDDKKVKGNVRTEPCPYTTRKLARTVATPWVHIETVARGGSLRSFPDVVLAKATAVWEYTIYNVFKVFKCSLQKGHAGLHEGTETEEWVNAKTISETKEYDIGEPITPPESPGLPVESPPKK